MHIRHARDMKKSLMSLFTGIALSTLVACGGAEADAAANVAGTYKLDTAAMEAAMLAEMPEPAKADPQSAKMVKEMAAGMDISFELMADGTAKMSSKIAMMGKVTENSLSGTWKLDGDQMTMAMSEPDGEEEVKTVTWKDGSFSITEEEDGQKMTMSFHKQ